MPTATQITVTAAPHGGALAGSHGTVVEAGFGIVRAQIFIGPENFSSTSLNPNRELGLIIFSHPVMSAIASTFAADCRTGRHGSWQ
jgi:hypothetical protein